MENIEFYTLHMWTRIPTALSVLRRCSDTRVYDFTFVCPTLGYLYLNTDVNSEVRILRSDYIEAVYADGMKLGFMLPEQAESRHLTMAHALPRPCILSSFGRVGEQPARPHIS